MNDYYTEPYQRVYRDVLPKIIKRLEDTLADYEKAHPEEKADNLMVYLGKNVVHSLDSASVATQNTIHKLFNMGNSAEKRAEVDEYIKQNTAELEQRGAEIQKKRPELPKAVNSFIKNVGQSSEMAPTVLMSLLNPAAGLATTGVQSFGGSYGTALNEGATSGEATKYAIGTTAAEVILEKLIGNKLFGGQTATGSATDKAIKKVVKNEVAQKAIIGIIEHGGEGAEEVAMAYIEPLIKKLSYADTYDAPNADEVIESFFGGVIGSATWSGVATLGNSISKKSTPSTETTHKAPIAEKPQVIAPVSTEVSADASIAKVNAKDGIFDRKVGTTKNFATQNDIDRYVDYAYRYADETNNKDNKEFPKQKSSIVIGKTDERLVADLQRYFGIDVSGTYHTINDNDIRHIKNSHGEQTNEKYPVTAEDLKQIPDIINNYDDVLYAENGGKKGIYYVKRHNGVTYYLEAINETGKVLSNKQMIKVATGTIPNIAGLKDAINKKWNISSAPDDSRIPRMYVQDVWNDNVPTDNIPQNGDTVNNEYMQNNEENVPSYEDFKETVLEQYPNMPEDAIREGYNDLYGLTDEGGNDIINNNDVYYQRRETDGPQGRYNGNSNEQGGNDIESADSIRTEGYKFRDGRDYRTQRAGLWQKAYGRVSGTLKKTSSKYIRHGNRAIMFSEYDNAKSVKHFFKDVYNRDVIICKDDIIERDFGSKGMPEFNASAAYVQGSILISLGRNSETSLVHEMVHEGQNSIEHVNVVNAIKNLINESTLNKLVLKKKSGYGTTYENRVNFDDDILTETYADMISKLSTKEWHEYGSGRELFSDEASYNRAKEIAEDYVVHLINNPPQNKVDTIIKDVSELGDDFADDYMFEKSESNPYFALRESEAEKALAYMEQNYGEMYRNLIKQYGAIKKGEGPRIDVDVPKKSGKNQYISNYARTMAETKVFSDAMQGEFEKMVVDGTLSM